MSRPTPAEQEMRARAQLCEMFVANSRDILALLDALESARAAIRRLMDQPTMHPLSMTPDQRRELWAAHAEARAHLGGQA